MPFLKLPIPFQPRTQIAALRAGQPGLQIDNHKVLVRYRSHYKNCRRQAEPQVENDDVVEPRFLMYEPAAGAQPAQQEQPRFRLARATAVESSRPLPRSFWHIFDFGEDGLAADDGNPRQRIVGLAFEGQRFTEALRNATEPDVRLIAMYEAFIRHELIQLSVELSDDGVAASHDVTPLFLQL